jgi:small subunit ribosomal protein S17
MSDENKETTDETQQDEAAQDESPQDAGPVADEGSSSSQAAGEDPSSAPPASEGSEADGSDASASEAEEETPAAEEPSEPDPEGGLPWKERRRLAKSRRTRKGRSSNPEERKAERLEARKRKAALRRKQRAAAKAAHAAGTGTSPVERESNPAKVRQGVVVSSRADKSITVRIDIARRHRTYEKIVRSSRTLHAHDERNEAGEGDVVRVVETRPLSKTKRWRLVDVIEKAR